ncbi:MAG TPA: 16S rRNA (guanine(527)-N(7))-methyltransferase RsmG [Kineosporiaceae bacterium]
MTTPEAAPPNEPVGAVTALFRERADVARMFRSHLATSAVERGLLGPREIPRLWERHILNCVAISAFVPQKSTMVDVGSGAGLPGLAIAIARPDVEVTLVEPLQRRVGWLDEVVADLGLTNVMVVRARAEDLRGHLLVEVATARAVAALPVLAGWCLPLLQPAGRLLALKGRTAEAELAASVDALRNLGAQRWQVRQVGGGVLTEPTTVIEVIAGRLPDRRGGGPGRKRERRSAAGGDAGSRSSTWGSSGRGHGGPLGRRGRSR